MAEFPSRSCSACDTKPEYARVADIHGDYLARNSVPRPELVHTDHMTIRDQHPHGDLAIPAAIQRPDLSVSPIKDPPPVQIPLGMTPSTMDTSENNKPAPSGFCCQPHEIPVESIPCNDNDNPYALKTYGNPALEFSIPSMDRNRNSQYNQQQQQRLQQETIGQVHKQLKAASQLEGAPLKGILKNSVAPCPCVDGTGRAEGAPQQQKPPQIFGVQDPSAGRGAKDKQLEEQVHRECYLPKQEDSFPDTRETLGAWATGRVDWSPLAGLTGIRPVVSKYSITKFSEGEWRAHNKEVLDGILDARHRANLLAFNAKAATDTACQNADRGQADSTRRLQQREAELHHYKCELERAISASDEEITNILEARRRLKQSMAVLQMPEAIAGEALERRTGRLDQELVRDEVEEELIREMDLCSEIRDQFTRALVDIEHQLLEDMTAKSRLEHDWSDKQQTNEAEAINVALNNRSTILLFKPGAVGFPDNQSTQEHWEKFTRETLEESELTRQRSVTLRGTLASLCKNAAENLRSQADRVELALQKRINCMEEMRIRLENDLHNNLKQIADVEATTTSLRDVIRRLDSPLKCAQTRLDNRRIYRPRVENCRDAVHYGLVEEVKQISDDVTAVMSQLKQAEMILNDLMQTRGNLEREIFNKRKTLEVDRDRIQKIRSYFPTITALQGF